MNAGYRVGVSVVEHPWGGELVPRSPGRAEEGFSALKAAWEHPGGFFEGGSSGGFPSTNLACPLTPTRLAGKRGQDTSGQKCSGQGDFGVTGVWR